MTSTSSGETGRHPHRSLWADGIDWTRRPALDGDTSVDLAIVGGGLTGLWTAWALAMAEPSMRILVIEAQTCGFGASGRNGGWCSALFPSEPPEMVEPMRRTLDAVLADTAMEGIDCDAAKGGTLTLVTSPAHLDRVQALARHPHYEWLDAAETRRRLRASGTLGAAFTPDCAAVHPAKLVRGVATAAEQRGVRIVEGTRATRLDPGAVTTDHGRVRADVVLRCTEGYTPGLEGHRRDIVPLYSLMIATEPLRADTWEEIGLAERETFTDGRHMIIYGQRTADGRFAFGGRGAPYHFASRVKPAFDDDTAVWRSLEQELRRLFPQIGDARVTHRWGGPLGVARDWEASVGFDPGSGLGWAGGYVGDGVATTNLAGRTLRDLVLGEDTELTRLPWVGHRSRRWEPEPLRYLGINLGRAIAGWADAREERTERPAKLLGSVMDVLTG